MISASSLASLARLEGIASSYRDLAGNEQPTSPDTQLALLKASGWELDNQSMVTDALKQVRALRRDRLVPEELIINAGNEHRFETAHDGTWHLFLEGTFDAFSEGRFEGAINIPAMPSGIHKLTVQCGQKSEAIRLIVAPLAAPSVFDVTGHDRLWGINLGLYGLHSDRNPGIGDYEDLARAGTSFASHSADFYGINPVHAMGWSNHEFISPYSPSHRGFLNSAHLALDQIEPISEPTLSMLAQWKEHAANRSGKQVDYRYHADHHRPLLRALYSDFLALATVQHKAAFDGYCTQDQKALRDFANFEHLRDPVDEPEFHMWLQWQAEQQLMSAHQQACSSGMKLGLYLDLAVGSRRDGAEAWVEGDCVAEDVSIGAPPDHLSPAGQNWNLMAFAPRKLASADYRSFRSVLARNMRHCGIIRIDHVLGLNRSFWIPDNGASGGYIKHNFEALLAIVRIEAERNQTVVIGEDLGLVPSGFRKRLQDSGIYSYSVLQYEKNRAGSFRKPSRLRKNSLACFGTHDTPTLHGFASERDIDWWQKLGWIDDKSDSNLRQQRKRECRQLKTLASIPDDKNSQQDSLKLTSISHSVHSALAASPVAMVSVQLDDIEEKTEAQNLPGTIDEHPNWQRRSSTPVSELKTHPALKKIGQLMGEKR